MNRRDFFKIVTTTGAVAAAGGCQQATEKILPLVVPNEQLVPGVASWFATVCRECPAGCGVVARNREGRIVKVEGNPEHPVNQGALCARGQASVQGVYHPDRFSGPQRRDGAALRPVAWDDALKLAADKLGAARSGGKSRGIVLVSQLESGSLGALMGRFATALGARGHVMLEPFGYEWIRAASRAVFNRDAIPHYAFEDAEVVLSFGADFVETWLSNVGYARGFARMHGFRGGRAGTFIHVEPRQSVTASNADEWVRNAPGTEAVVALAVLKVMVDEGMVDRRFAEAVGGVDVNKAAADSGVPGETIKRIAHAFGSGKPSLAVGGGVATAGSNATQTLAAINLLNAAAGNVGKTVRFGPDSAYGKVTPYAEVAQLAQAMASGEVEVLLIGPGVNPAFTLPGGLKFRDAMAKVPFVASFATQPDETTALAHLVLPDTHWLETWGDYSPREGVVGLMQPTMPPFRDARPMGDVLIALGRTVLGSEEGKGPLPWAGFEQYLRSTWEPVGQWEAALQQGGVWKDVAPAVVTAKSAPIDAAPPKLEGDAGGLVLIAYPSLRMYDGRTASRAWLQEVPDTMTQAAWDAWVEIPTETAARLGIARGDVVKITSPHGAIELPAYVSDSLHPGAVAVPIGHRYAPYQVPRYVRDPGSPLNPVALLSGQPDPASGGPTYLGVRVTLAKTGARRPLAVLQATHDQDHRELTRHVDLRTAREEALRGKSDKPHEMVSMYPPQQYPNFRWGMAVDTDLCIGCQACTVACIAENNIAVVGKAEAAYGRQLHWLRIERWAEGKASHPRTRSCPCSASTARSRPASPCARSSRPIAPTRG